MVDEIDRDQEINEHYLEALIARTRSGSESPSVHLFCCRCGDSIPEERRQALPGVLTCIDCQIEAEAHPRR